MVFGITLECRSDSFRNESQLRRNPIWLTSRGAVLRARDVEGFLTARSGAITPRCENPVARNNTSGEMGRVVERCAFSRHNHIGEQGIFGMHVCSAFNCCDHWYSHVSDVLDNLNAFIVNLAPNTGIAHVAEGCKIDSRDEVAACSG